jgi:hypothetical protein
MNTGDKSGNSVAFNTNRRVAIAQFFDAPGENIPFANK